MGLIGALVDVLFKGRKGGAGGGCDGGGCGGGGEAGGLNPFGEGGCCGGGSDMASASARMCQGGDMSSLPQLAFSDEQAIG